MIEMMSVVQYSVQGPTPPGKSWILFKVSRTWRALENEFGPGKS